MNLCKYMYIYILYVKYGCFRDVEDSYYGALIGYTVQTCSCLPAAPDEPTGYIVLYTALSKCEIQEERCLIHRYTG